MQAAAEVLSPELVLVSPPEVAARARLLLADPAPTFASPRVEADRTSNGLVLFYAGCIAGTLGPFLLAVLAR